MSELGSGGHHRVELSSAVPSERNRSLGTGNYGAEYIRSSIGFDPKNAVRSQLHESLDICRELGFKGALLVGHIGKLVKIAGAVMHSKYGDCRMGSRPCACASGLTPMSTAPSSVRCTTCHALLDEARIRQPVLARLTSRIAFMLNYRTSGEMETGAIVFSQKYGLLSETENARTLLRQITEE